MKRVRRDRPPWVTMHVYRASFMSVILPQTVSPLTRTTCSGCLMLLISEAISYLGRGTDYTHPGKISEAISYLGRGTDYSQLGPVAIHYRKSHKHAYVLLYLTLFWLYACEILADPCGVFAHFPSGLPQRHRGNLVAPVPMK